jgi:MFS family permease
MIPTDSGQVAEAPITRYRWVALFSAFLSFVAFAFSLQLAPPLMAPIIEEFGVSHASAGLLMSMVAIPGIFLAIPAGMIVDRYGTRLAGALSTALVALGCLLTAIGGSFSIALAGRLVVGVGGAFIVVAMPAVIPHWFPRRELGKAMGIYGINMPLASAVAFPLASVMNITLGWRYPFFAAAGLAAVATVVFAALARDGPLNVGGQERPDIGRAIRNVEIWKIGLVWLLFNAAALSFTTWGPKVFHDFRGMDTVSATVLASTLMLAAIPFAPFFGWFSDRMGRRKLLMVVGSVLVSISLVVVSFSSGLGLVAAVVGLGIVAAMVPPMVMALPPEILGPALAGTGFGVVTICLNVGITLAPPFSGYLLDTGSETLSFLAMAVFAALGAGVALTLRTR